MNAAKTTGPMTEIILQWTNSAKQLEEMGGYIVTKRIIVMNVSHPLKSQKNNGIEITR
jgi:hypothetical protein